MKVHSNIEYFLMIFLLAAIWGLSFSYIKIATVDFGAFPLAFIRIFFASIFLLIVIIAIGEIKQHCHYLINPKYVHHFFLSGLFGQLIPFMLFAKAELSISASMASILNATTPIWSVVIATIWLKTKFTGIQLMGISLSFIGVVILVTHANDDTNIRFDASLMGAFAIILATLCYAIGSNYIKHYMSSIPSLHLACGSTVYACLSGLPLALFYWPEHEISAGAWKAASILGFLCSGAAFVIFFKLISKYDATSAVSVTFLIPMFGVLSGIALLKEEISILMIVSLAIILSGIVLSNIKFKNQTKT